MRLAQQHPYTATAPRPQAQISLNASFDPAAPVELVVPPLKPPKSPNASLAAGAGAELPQTFEEEPPKRSFDWDCRCTVSDCDEGLRPATHLSRALRRSGRRTKAVERAEPTAARLSRSTPRITRTTTSKTQPSQPRRRARHSPLLLLLMLRSLLLLYRLLRPRWRCRSKERQNVCFGVPFRLLRSSSRRRSVEV